MIDASLIRPCPGGVKTCNRCEVEKPETEFKPYKKRGAYTRWFVCYACERDDWRSSKRLAKKRVAVAKRRADGKLKQAEDRRARRYMKLHPEKKRAGDYLRNAIRVGKVLRPSRCEECGKIPPPARGSSRPRIEAHHIDYSKPLAVRWLCKPCHNAQHEPKRWIS